MHACGVIPEGVQHLNIREFRKVKGHRIIKSQLTAFPEDHGCRGCGGLGHRTDAEQAVLVHGLAVVWVLDAKSLVTDNLSVSCEKEHCARNGSLIDIGFNGRSQTRPGSVLRQVEGDGLGVQSHPLLCSGLAGVERNSSGKEAEDSNWMRHGAQFRKEGPSNQVCGSFKIRVTATAQVWRTFEFTFATEPLHVKNRIAYEFSTHHCRYSHSVNRDYGGHLFHMVQCGHAGNWQARRFRIPPGV